MLILNWVNCECTDWKKRSYLDYVLELGWQLRVELPETAGSMFDWAAQVQGATKSWLLPSTVVPLMSPCLLRDDLLSLLGPREGPTLDHSLPRLQSNKNVLNIFFTDKLAKQYSSYSNLEGINLQIAFFIVCNFFHILYFFFTFLYNLYVTIHPLVCSFTPSKRN